MRFLFLYLLLICEFANATVFNPVLFIGEIIKGAIVGAPLSADANGKLVSGHSNSSVTVTSNTTTTSGTDALLNGMTLTPVAGTYQVIFDTNIQSTTGGNSVNVSVYSGGAQIANSIRTIQFPTATLIDSGYPFTVFTQANGVVVNGSQAITIEWHTSGGTATCLTRTLTILRTL